MEQAGGVAQRHYPHEARHREESALSEQGRELVNGDQESDEVDGRQGSPEDEPAEPVVGCLEPIQRLSCRPASGLALCAMAVRRDALAPLGLRLAGRTPVAAATVEAAAPQCRPAARAGGHGLVSLPCQPARSVGYMSELHRAIEHIAQRLVQLIPLSLSQARTGTFRM